MWLKYTRGATTSSRKFNELNVDVRSTTTREVVTTKREIEHDFLMSDRDLYTLSIGADEMVDETARTFITEFWRSHQRWISISDSATEPDGSEYVELTMEGGDLPVEFIDGDFDFPTITITMRAKYPKV